MRPHAAGLRIHEHNVASACERHAFPQGKSVPPTGPGFQPHFTVCPEYPLQCFTIRRAQSSAPLAPDVNTLLERGPGQDLVERFLGGARTALPASGAAGAGFAPCRPRGLTGLCSPFLLRRRRGLSGFKSPLAFSPVVATCVLSYFCESGKGLRASDSSLAFFP